MDRRGRCTIAAADCERPGHLLGTRFVETGLPRRAAAAALYALVRRVTTQDGRLTDWDVPCGHARTLDPRAALELHAALDAAREGPANPKD